MNNNLDCGHCLCEIANISITMPEGQNRRKVKWNSECAQLKLMHLMHLTSTVQST